MRPRLARLLVRGFPRAWRRRYGEECALLLEQHPPGWRPVASTLLWRRAPATRPTAAQ